jgi:hypothetical protein
MAGVKLPWFLALILPDPAPHYCCTSVVSCNIYEALRAVEAGSADYLNRVSVEFRDPAISILHRIAPDLCGLPEEAAIF